MRRDVFQAIADPTRRTIIALVALQAMTPNALAEEFDTTRQSISKHLRILTECELITQEHKGREIYYSLELNKMKEIDQWLEQFRRIWEDRFNQLDNVLSIIKKKKMKSNLLFDFTVDKAANTVFVNREFAADQSSVWDAFTKQESLTNGGRLSPGSPKQSTWTLKLVGGDFMQCVALKEKNTGQFRTSKP